MSMAEVVKCLESLCSLVCWLCPPDPAVAPSGVLGLVYGQNLPKKPKTTKVLPWTLAGELEVEQGRCESLGHLSYKP